MVVFHQLTKANRALRRKNKNFIEKEVLRNHKYGKIQTTDGKFRVVSIGNPDYERLTKCLEHIAKGLYYHEFDEIFQGELGMILEFIEYIDENTETLKKFLKRRFEVEKELNLEIKGDNPEVFYYQFHKPDKFGLIALKITFYGSAEAYVSFKSKDSNEPFDLGMKLISGGIHSFIELGDEKFEFNKKITANSKLPDKSGFGASLTGN